MRLVISKKELLQNFGMIILALFFYIYAVGNSFGFGDYYLYLFNFASVIAIFLLCQDISVLLKYKRYYLWQAIFILFVACTSVYTINTEHAFAQIIAILKILFKVSVVSVICSDFDGIKKLMKVFCCLGGVSFITLLSTGKLYEGWRLGTELMGNANSFALIITIFLTGAMYNIFSAETKVFRMISIGCFICDIYMLFLSGGRKFLLYAIVFLYCSFLISKEGRIKIRNIVMATVVVVALVAIAYHLIMTVDVLYQAIGIRLIGLGSDSGALGVADQSGLMLRGISMFLRRPLLGWGIGGFQQYSYINYGIYIYAHSNYIELLADFGIVGTLLYYSQYLYCLKSMLLYKKYSELDEYKLFFPLMVSIIVIDLFAITFNQTAFIPLFLMFISGYTYNLRQQAASEG